jgi:hypothetical protein
VSEGWRYQNIKIVRCLKYRGCVIMSSFVWLYFYISHVYDILLYWTAKRVYSFKHRPILTHDDTPKSDDRTVRLFVSSTFQDMQGERQVLQDEVFPVVRRFLWERGIAFIGVDLRWGITREEAERGDVLDICLREIDQCRPWVLGLLGARYGWIDPHAAERLAGEPRFSRLAGYGTASVTELEFYVSQNRYSQTGSRTSQTVNQVVAN